MCVRLLYRWQMRQRKHDQLRPQLDCKTAAHTACMAARNAIQAPTHTRRMENAQSQIKTSSSMRISCSCAFGLSRVRRTVCAMVAISLRRSAAAAGRGVSCVLRRSSLLHDASGAPVQRMDGKKTADGATV